MAIKLGDNLYLSRDKYQWWFSKKYETKKGDVAYKPITGFFRELSGAFEDLGDKEKRVVEAAGIPELIEAIKHHEAVMRELAEEIMEALNE